MQKFDVDDSDGDLYYHQYQQNVEAPRTESISIMQSYKEIDENLNMPFNFVIPVFEDMPETKSPLPGTESIVTQNLEVTDPSIEVYKSKNKSSTKLATLKKGDKVLRIEIDNNKTNGYTWSKVVLNNGTKGYVISEGFKVIDDITNCEIEAVAIEPGNVRNGPGTSGTEVLLTLTEGQRVTIIEKGKYNNVDGYDWSRIVLADGTQGYVVARYLEEVDSNTGSTESGAEIVKVVCDGGLTLRKEPGTSSSILEYIDKGEYLTRIEKNSANKNGYIWDKVVTSSGTTGYVARGDDDEDYIRVVGNTASGDGFETSGSNLVCEPDVTVSNITSKLSGAVVKNAKGAKVTSGNVGTGYTITYDDKTYTVVKLGDTTGNGKVDSADLLAIQRHLLGKTIIVNQYQLKAADTTGNGKVDSADLLAVQRELLGKSNISI